jgi:hypothetical protein
MSRISNLAVAGLAATTLSTLMSQTALARGMHFAGPGPAFHAAVPTVHVPVTAVHLRAANLSVRQADAREVRHDKSNNGLTWKQPASVKPANTVQAGAVRLPMVAIQFQLPPAALSQVNNPAQSQWNWLSSPAGNNPAQDQWNWPSSPGGNNPAQDQWNWPSSPGGNNPAQNQWTWPSFATNGTPYSGVPGSGPYGSNGGAAVTLLNGQQGMVSDDQNDPNYLAPVSLVDPFGSQSSNGGSNQPSSGNSGQGNAGGTPNALVSVGSASIVGQTTQGGSSKGNCTTGCGSEPGDGDNDGATVAGSAAIKAAALLKAERVDPGPDTNGVSGGATLLNASSLGHSGDFADVGASGITSAEMAAVNRVVSGHQGD